MHQIYIEAWVQAFCLSVERHFYRWILAFSPYSDCSENAVIEKKGCGHYPIGHFSLGD